MTVATLGLSRKSRSPLGEQCGQFTVRRLGRVIPAQAAVRAAEEGVGADDAMARHKAG